MPLPRALPDFDEKTNEQHPRENRYIKLHVHLFVEE